MKLTGENSIHCQVITKKKHPRIYLKVSRKHEHFLVDKQTSDIIKYISSDELEKLHTIDSLKDAVQFNEMKSSSPTLPKSTFNLTLKKDEQEAKDSLILPYIRYQILFYYSD